MSDNTEQLKYAEYRRKKQVEGEAFQDYVEDVLEKMWGFRLNCYKTKEEQYKIGENKFGMEIKLDNSFRDSMRLWIEIAEKAMPREGDFVKSGIYRDDNAWLYLIGDYDMFYIYSKNMLQLLHRSHCYEEYENETSRCFFLPFRDALNYAALVVDPNKMTSRFG